MKFNLKLIEMRKKQGWSQEQLGEKINVTRQTVSKWELGETTPEMKKLLELSELFDISIDKLVGNILSNQTHSEKMNPFIGWRYPYEYISERKIFNLPLIHINIGKKKNKAKGIIAIGNSAYGLIAIGYVAMGGLSIGLLSFGIISLGLLSFALLLSVSTVAIGTVAMGVISLGIFAIGAVPFGIYSLGAIAVGHNIALGAYADATVAIGNIVSGEIIFQTDSLIRSEEVRTAIMQKLPDTPKCIVNFFAKLAEIAS